MQLKLARARKSVDAQKRSFHEQKNLWEFHKIRFGKMLSYARITTQSTTSGKELSLATLYKYGADATYTKYVAARKLV